MLQYMKVEKLSTAGVKAIQIRTGGMRNPNIKILFISAKTGEGIPELAEWIFKQVRQWNL